MQKEVLEFSIDSELYEKINALAKENNTTVEEICEKFIHLCVKEGGLVVFDSENSYQVLKTKEDVNNYLNAKGYDCNNCEHSRYAGYASLDGVEEFCNVFEEKLETVGNKTLPCAKCMGTKFVPDSW